MTNLLCHACRNKVLEEDPKPKDILGCPVCDRCYDADQAVREMQRMGRVTRREYQLYREELEVRLRRSKLNRLLLTNEHVVEPFNQLRLLK